MNFSRVARAALYKYDLPRVRFKRLRAGENVTYRVEVDDHIPIPEDMDSANLARYSPTTLLLRIHRPQNHLRARLWNRPEVVQGELDWLKQLALNTQVIVPLPLTAKCGCEVTTVSLEGKEYVCTLMRWVLGRYTTVTPSPRTSLALGTAVARLHQQSQGWIGDELVRAVQGRPLVEEFPFHFQDVEARLLSLKGPRGLERPLYDGAMLIGWERVVLARARSRGMPADLADSIATSLSAAENVVRKLPITSKTFGLIHADLAPDNYVVYRGSLRPIDFSCCGFGWYIFDTAWALAHLMKDAHAAFLRGYRAVRPLSDVELSDLQTLIGLVRTSLVLQYWPDRCIYVP